MSRLTELIKYHEQHVEDLAESYGIATKHMEMGEVKAYAGHCQRQDDTLTYLKELQHYEDLEEQGRLIELPCKVGDTVYAVYSDVYCRQYWACGEDINERLCIQKGECPFLYKKTTVIDRKFDLNMSNKVGKTVFLTKEEAEAKLAELKGTEE